MKEDDHGQGPLLIVNKGTYKRELSNIKAVYEIAIFGANQKLILLYSERANILGSDRYSDPVERAVISDAINGSIRIEDFATIEQLLRREKGESNSRSWSLAIHEAHFVEKLAIDQATITLVAQLEWLFGDIFKEIFSYRPDLMKGFLSPKLSFSADQLLEILLNNSGLGNGS